jgi:hypothetical protein
MSKNVMLDLEGSLERGNMANPHATLIWCLGDGGTALFLFLESESYVSFLGSSL